jgi:zinc transporter ZupT
MGKKLLLAAVTTFLLMAVVIAFYSDGSLAGAHSNYLGDVWIYSVFTFPLSAAIVIWEHRSSRALKCWSAGAGLAIALTAVWLLGPASSLSSELQTSAEAFYRTIAILSCFIFSSSLISVAGRISIRLWALVRHLILKLKNLGKAGAYEMPV